MTGILWLLFIVLLVLWLIGFSVNWGAFIWILLIAAIAVLFLNLISVFTNRGHWH